MLKTYIFNDLCGLGAHGVRHPSAVRIEFSKTPENEHFYVTCTCVLPSTTLHLQAWCTLQKKMLCIPRGRMNYKDTEPICRSFTLCF